MHQATCLEQLGWHLPLCDRLGGESPAEARGRTDLRNPILHRRPEALGEFGMDAHEPTPFVVRAEVDHAARAPAEDKVPAVRNPEADEVAP